MQWKVQDWNRNFFLTKNYQNAEDPICKHAACSYGEVIDSLSVVVPAPHKLLPENEEVTAMPLEDLEGGWLLVLFFMFFSGFAEGLNAPFGLGFVSKTPKVTGFEVKGLIKWKVKKTQECTRKLIGMNSKYFRAQPGIDYGF